MRNQRKVLSGIAPLMGVQEDLASAPANGESKGATAAEGPSQTETNASTPPAATPESPVARSSTPQGRAAPEGERIPVDDDAGDSSATSAWKTGALTLAAAGLALGVVPHLSDAAAAWLHAAGDLQTMAGPLLVAALVAYAFGRLQARIVGVRQSITSVRNDTVRIEQIAASGHTLSASIDLVRHANATLTGDLNKLQGQMAKLTEIVSNPDYTVSIFRLAASVDQLGKHLQTQITDRFEALQQRAVSLADQTGQVERQISTRVEQLGAAVKDGHRTQQVAVQEGFAQARAAAEQAIAKLEEGLKSSARIEARVQKQHEVASGDLTALSNRQSKATHELAAALTEIRNRIDRQFEEHAAALVAKLEALDGRIDLSDREQATNLQELGVQLEGRWTDHVEELKQRLRSLAETAEGGLASVSNRQAQATHELSAALAESRNRVDHQFEENVAALLAKLEGLDGRIDVSDREQSANFQTLGVQLEGRWNDQVEDLKQRLRAIGETTEGGLASLTNRQSQSTHELAASLTEMRNRVDHQFEEHVAALLARLEGLDGRIGGSDREQAANLQSLGVQLEGRWNDQVEELKQRLRSLAEVADGSRQESASQLGILGTRVDDFARNQAALLGSLREHTAETGQKLRREIGTSLERIEAQLEQKGREHVASMRKNVQEAQQAAIAAQRDLLKSLERIDVQIEKQGREQQTTLQKASQEDQQASAAIRRELSTRIEEIAAGLEQETQAHLAAVQRASQEALAGTATLRHEIAEGLTGLAARVEERLEAECNDLAGDLVALSEMFTSTAIDLRSTVEKLSANAPRSAVEAVLPPLVEAPAIDADEPTPAPIDELRSEPTAAVSPETSVEPAVEPAPETSSPTAIEVALDAALDTTREITPEAPPDSALSEPTTIVWIPPPPTEPPAEGGPDATRPDGSLG